LFGSRRFGFFALLICHGDEMKQVAVHFAEDCLFIANRRLRAFRAEESSTSTLDVSGFLVVKSTLRRR